MDLNPLLSQQQQQPTGLVYILQQPIPPQSLLFPPISSLPSNTIINSMNPVPVPNPSDWVSNAAASVPTIDPNMPLISQTLINQDYNNNPVPMQYNNNNTQQNNTTSSSSNNNNNTRTTTTTSSSSQSNSTGPQKRKSIGSTSKSKKKRSRKESEISDYSSESDNEENIVYADEVSEEEEEEKYLYDEYSGAPIQYSDVQAEEFTADPEVWQTLNDIHAPIPEIAAPSAVVNAALQSDWMISCDILTLRIKPSVSKPKKDPNEQDFWAYSFLPSKFHEYLSPNYTFHYQGSNYTVHYLGDAPIKKDLKINANFVIEFIGPSGKQLTKKFTICRQYPATKPSPKKLVLLNQSMIFEVEAVSEVPMYQFGASGRYEYLIRKCTCPKDCPLHNKLIINQQSQQQTTDNANTTTSTTTTTSSSTNSNPTSSSSSNINNTTTSSNSSVPSTYSPSTTSSTVFPPLSNPPTVFSPHIPTKLAEPQPATKF